jgi:hypothetical protein
MKLPIRRYLPVSWIAIAVCALPAQSPKLSVERQGDLLRVHAPQMHFLEGKPLEQLRNGTSVSYEFEVTVTAIPGERKIHQSQARFTVSFDLWEERFAVIQTTPSRRAGSHMTSTAAEAWCLENLNIPLPALSPEKTFVIKLACRVAGNGEEAGAESRPGATALAGLIEIFSRRGGGQEQRWEAISASLKLGDLKAKNTPSAQGRPWRD